MKRQTKKLNSKKIIQVVTMLILCLILVFACIFGYSVYKDMNGAKEYQIIFLVNEDKALDIRKKALNAALEESKLRQEYATQISDFINDKITQITE